MQSTNHQFELGYLERKSFFLGQYGVYMCTHTVITVASWLVRSINDRAVLVRALAGDIVLYSWARHSTLTVPLSTLVNKWVPANLMLGVPLRWTRIPYSMIIYDTGRETGFGSGLMGPLARLLLFLLAMSNIFRYLRARNSGIHQ